MSIACKGFNHLLVKGKDKVKVFGCMLSCLHCLQRVQSFVSKGKDKIKIKRKPRRSLRQTRSSRHHGEIKKSPLILILDYSLQVWPVWHPKSGQFEIIQYKTKFSIKSIYTFTCFCVREASEVKHINKSPWTLSLTIYVSESMLSIPGYNRMGESWELIY